MAEENVGNEKRLRKDINGLDLKLIDNTIFDILELNPASGGRAGEPVKKFKAEKVREVIVGEYLFNDERVRSVNGGYIRLFIKKVCGHEGIYEYWSLKKDLDKEELERIRNLLGSQPSYSIENMGIVKRKSFNHGDYVED